MKRILFLAARTARSQAYAQSLHRYGLIPQQTILFGPEPAPLRLTAAAVGVPGVDLPDLAEPLSETTRGWPARSIAAADVNDPAILAAVRAAAPELIVYSGPGGQIVGTGLLGLGVPMLHAHSGWLPEYRGSTTLYYALLRERHCAVSVFVLAAGIDTGAIVARRAFPPPPPGLDVDLVFDGAIRATAMREVVAAYRRDGALPPALTQAPADGATYYVIHPLLKHLALLSPNLAPQEPR